MGVFLCKILKKIVVFYYIGILKGIFTLRNTFYYKKYDFNAQTGVLTFTYETNGYTFVETITFPGAPFNVSNDVQKALDSIFFYAHIAFGISYYKAFLPPQIKIETGELTPEEALFFKTFYLSGLGEFSVKNNVDLNIEFPVHSKTPREQIDLILANKILVPVGGGKDSCVTMELLKGRSITAFSVGNPRPIQECVTVSGLNRIVLKRSLAPQLLALNNQPGIYNGHVPITGLIAFLLWASAVLYDYKYVAMSCEQSANSENMTKNGLKINHQYSKSLDFEQDFYKLTHKITPNFLYFSLLRPISEAHIAKLFATLCTPYFDIFTSCNKAFKLDETKRLDRWCGMCDKCRFVFLILAPFMDKEKLIQIVGNNPLNDPKQLTGYEELLGVTGHKPFECVGDISECQWALAQLAQNDQWKNDFVVKKLSKKINKNQKDIFNFSSNNLIPETFDEILFHMNKESFSFTPTWDHLAHKKIGIWGMGKEGCAAKAALEKYVKTARIINITEDTLDRIYQCDVIIKSPGVSLYRPEIKQALKRGIFITSGTNLFLANKRPAQKIIAVTGTKGKSTTSSLLAHTLKKMGLAVALGGNIGVPLVSLVDDPADIIVAELSSYQCADIQGNIDIAVLVNLYPEHLPWHKSHDQYYADKIHMIHQATYKILNALDPRTQELVHMPTAYYFNIPENTLNKTCDFPLRGQHNQQNASAVLAVIQTLGLDTGQAEQAFQSFKPLAHRLDILGTKDGITYVDDSISTTPETAIAAMEAFKGHPLTLIAGGQDRGQDFTKLAAYIKIHDVRLITLPDTGSRLQQVAGGTYVKTMCEAVQLAQQITPADGIVLLSPAAPSYNAYKNFEERGDDFKKYALG